MPTITAERLRELLSYDQETGLLTWLVSQGTIKVGTVAGHTEKNGYVRIKADRKNYKAHRLAWFWMTGEWPNPECDHWDMNPSNNRWANLRKAVRSQNCANRHAQANNKCGMKGVYWHKQSQTWRAQAVVDGMKRTLGNFKNKEAAQVAYMLAAAKTYGPFARAS